MGLIVAFFVYMIYLTYVDVASGETIPEAMIGFVFWFFVGCLVLVPITRILGFLTPKKWIELSERHLVALRDERVASGNFFLGCGSLNEQGAYVFYEQTSNGGYRQERVPVTISTVFEEEGRTGGTLKTFERTFIHPLFFLVGFTDPDDENHGIRYDFHIPKGSLRQEFTL